MTLDMRDLMEEAEAEDDLSKSILDRCIYRMEKLGIGLCERPMKKGKPYVPKIPARGITTLSDRELGDLHGDFVVMQEYVGEQAIFQSIIQREYAAEADKYYRMVKLKAEGSVADRDDRARIHPKVLKLKEKRDVAHGTKEMLYNRYEGFKGGANVCSRDVERRKDTLDSSKREAAMAKRGRVVKRSTGRQSDIEVR